MKMHWTRGPEFDSQLHFPVVWPWVSHGATSGKPWCAFATRNLWGGLISQCIVLEDSECAILEQGLAHYGPQAKSTSTTYFSQENCTGTQPGFFNHILFHATMAKLSSCYRDCMTCKAGHTYYLALYRNNLAHLVLDSCTDSCWSWNPSPHM